MTATAWRQGTINALICGFSLILALLALSLVLTATPHRSFAESFRLAFQVAWVATFLTFFYTWMHSRLSRGRVLLDCGPHPTRWLFFLSFLLMIPTLGADAFRSSPEGINALKFTQAASLGVFLLIIVSGRLQITERGLWQYWGLMRWNNIKSHQWTADSTLLLTSNRWSLLRGALPVPPKYKQSVDDFLTRCRGVETAGASEERED